MNQRSAPVVDRSEQIVKSCFARFDIRCLATSLGLTLAFLLFAVTASLLLRDLPHDSMVVQRVALLAQYFPGFTVSWTGAALGAAYAFVGGFSVGTAIGIAWNLAHFMFVMNADRRLGSTGNL